jgi:hypothetical protein
LRLAVGDGSTLAMLHEFGRVLGTRYDGDTVEVEAEIPESVLRAIHSAVENLEEKREE